MFENRLSKKEGYYRLAIVFAMFVVFAMLFASCSMIGDFKKPDGSEYSTKTKITTDYITTKTALIDARLQINMSCQSANTSICKKARRYYNVGADVYVALGELDKALVDPVNSIEYGITAMQILNFTTDTYSEYINLIIVINQMRGILNDDLSDEEKMMSAVVILNTQLLDAVFTILNEGGN